MVTSCSNLDDSPSSTKMFTAGLYPYWKHSGQFSGRFAGSLLLWSRRVGTSQICSSWSVQFLRSVGGRFSGNLSLYSRGLVSVGQSEGCGRD